MLASKDICTGCGSCAAVCPKNCIEMARDPEGFRYPVVDISRCVDCGLCAQGCPVIAPVKCHDLPKAWGAKLQDEQLRQASSSGGVFSALAEMVLEEGGAVCAAEYDECFGVAHRIIKGKSALAALRGAKYTQSWVEQCFAEIQQLLKQDVQVLFVGTPCQVAGLRGYLGREYPKLLTVDMICHGVPSPVVWEKYLTERGRLDAGGAAIRAVNLRSKNTGWSRYCYSVTIDYQNGAYYSASQGEDPFMRGFVGNLYLRPSCAACSFKGMQRCSDLTLGDFWGIWDIMPEFDDNRGTSLLLVHSEAGRQAWEAVWRRFETMETDAEAALAYNPSALVSSAPHPKRDAFFEEMQKRELIPLIRECLEPQWKKPSLLKRIRNRLKIR